MFKFAGSNSKLDSFQTLIPKPEPIQTVELDIICMICEELQFGALMAFDRKWRSDDDLACRKGLLSFGLSCKAFMEPAFNVLWRALGTVEPLLSVLPETTVVDGKKVRCILMSPLLLICISSCHRCSSNR